MIDLPDGVEAALLADRKPAHLITVEIGDNSYHFTEAGQDIVYGGNTYLANGVVQTMGKPKYTSEARVNSNTVTFSGADQTMIASLLNNDGAINKRLTVQRVWLGDDGQVIDSYALLLNRYWITGYSGSEKWRGESVISVKVASVFARWETPKGRRTTMASQQNFYPTDKGMEFATDVKIETEWGAPI